MATCFGIRSKITFCLTLVVGLMGLCASANESIENPPSRVLDWQMERKISEAERELEALLRKVSRLNQSPSKGPQRLIDLQRQESRKELHGFLDISIRMKAKHLEHLKRQWRYLKDDDALTDAIRLAYRTKTPASRRSDNSFSCVASPLLIEEGTSLRVLHDFGSLLNPDLGQSSAKSQGLWWEATSGVLVRSCAAGEVILSERIEGRGHVVGIRHNRNAITLYGNINPETAKDIRVGMQVSGGAPLGLAMDSFYFEFRNGTEAKNPAAIISAAR